MAISLYVILNGDTVANTVLVDPTDTAYIQATGAIDVSGIDPEPAVGWTTSDAGKTFTAPPSAPVPAPTPQEVARADLVSLVAAIPGHIAQAQADAATVAGMTAGQPLTATQVGALANHANGWVTLLQALQTLTAAMGVA